MLSSQLFLGLPSGVSLELHVYKLLSRRTYTTYVTTASNTSLLILHVSIREL